jgi:hypothetical protein
MQEEASQRQEALRRQTEEQIQASRRETSRQKAGAYTRPLNGSTSDVFGH